MESKYSDPSIQGLLNLCTFLDSRFNIDPRFNMYSRGSICIQYVFKFDYIIYDRLHDSTVDLIKGTIQQQIIDLIRKESRESEASEQHDNLQREAEQPSQPPRKKKG